MGRFESSGITSLKVPDVLLLPPVIPEVSVEPEAIANVFRDPNMLNWDYLALKEKLLSYVTYDDREYVERAYTIAEQAHNGQTRKGYDGSSYHYIVHPVRASLRFINSHH